jgi:hypothetical protein
MLRIRIQKKCGSGFGYETLPKNIDFIKKSLANDTMTDKQYWVGYRRQLVLRIRDVYKTFFHPGSELSPARIPDPHQRI